MVTMFISSKYEHDQYRLLWMSVFFFLCVVSGSTDIHSLTLYCMLIPFCLNVCVVGWFRLVVWSVCWDARLVGQSLHHNKAKDKCR